MAICAAIAVALSMFFTVETITVSGTQRYHEKTIVEASGIQQGDNMFLMDKYSVCDAITSTLPYVETVQLRRSLPDTLVLTVTECDAPAALIQNGRAWLLSPQGKIVDSKVLGAARDYTRISGLALQDPVIGAQLQVEEGKETDASEMLMLLRLLDNKGMLSQVQSLDLSDTEVVSLRYLDRFDVTIPRGSDYSYKLDYLLAVVDRLEINEKGTIDMTQEGKASFIPE